jgi:predicted SAM-dependent methyltransferase
MALKNKLKKGLKRIIPGSTLELVRLVKCHRQKTKSVKINSLAAKKIVAKYHNQPGSIQIELGSAIKRDGWIVVDLQAGADLVWDLTMPLPFPDEWADKIYCSHLLEHFAYQDLINILNEIKRVLKKGGAFIVSVPDVSIYLQLSRDEMKYAEILKEHVNKQYQSFRELLEQNNSWFKYYSPLSVLNYIAYMDGKHKYMFDVLELIEMLKFIGFSDVKKRPFDNELDLKVREWESLHILASK